MQWIFLPDVWDSKRLYGIAQVEIESQQDGIFLCSGGIRFEDGSYVDSGFCLFVCLFIYISHFLIAISLREGLWAVYNLNTKIKH